MKNILKHKKIITIGGIFLLLCAISVAVFYFRKNIWPSTAPATDENSQQRSLSEQKAAETISAVEQLMDIPDEEPTVATVNDLSKLQGQAFFAKAEEGDRVLFFSQAKKAILYRPAANKIIEVSALEVEN